MSSLPGSKIPTAADQYCGATREGAITRLRRIRDRRRKQLEDLDALEKWLTGHDINSLQGPGEELLWRLLNEVDRC